VKGKVVLITGGSSGIGEATARLFASQGSKVVLSARGSENGVAVAADIDSSGGHAEFIQADVSRAEDVENLIEEILNRHGRVDCAFNNAGIVGTHGPLADYADTDWDSVIQTNLSGVYYCMKHELRAMLANGGGAIVNNASIMGHRGNPVFGPAYGASKHGVIGLTKTAALQYADKDIRINAVSPGVIETPMVAADMGSDSAVYDMVRAWHPMGRLGKTAEVASAVYWLCSEGAGFVTGQAIGIDGGSAANWGFNAQVPNPF
jgi:NAD(P)-dependent dehydrogenase (short-subunit alcohol dehydrogenase family)